jgi:hypothetical protein
VSDNVEKRFKTGDDDDKIRMHATIISLYCWNKCGVLLLAAKKNAWKYLQTEYPGTCLDLRRMK